MSDSPRQHQSPAEFSGRSPAATFTSCLDIAVQGAIPIEQLESSSSAGKKDSAKLLGSDSKRAPRKSKTDAIAALNAAASQEESNERVLSDEAGVRVTLRDGPPIPVSPLLNLSTVKTPNYHNTPSKPKERPFGLTDCPTFRPTPEQFKDPMAYIKSIAENAKSYGMCKIVPPMGWSMPFVTDTETFRFKTRLQRLNSIEASSRAKVNFLELLYRFHKQQGNPRVSVPTINHKPLDLWLLRKEVHRLGGYEQVTKTKKWADLGRLLGYGGVPGLATQLKNSYARVILPYEHFCDHVRNSPNMSPSTKQSDPNLKTHTNIQTAGKPGGSSMERDNESPPSSPLSTTSSELSDLPDDSETRLRRSVRQTQDQPTPLRQRAAPSDGNQPPTEPHCEVCQKKDRGEEMLLCDGCDCGFHTFCLDPPLQTIPKGQWYCHICLFGTGGDFGFDEGEEHCLASFQARDQEFRKLWFKSHPPTHDDEDRIYAHETSGTSSDPAVNRIGDVKVSETDVELEFWRLVQSQNETVEVEYGADVHSTTHGSAMPTSETHPLNTYSKDPWNLNNIPILPESLLRYIKSDISGMTVPWTYVGMIFSTFCWHNEDHYTYSINYMHWGETKTWYSIPGDDAEKFEAAIRKEAPDLFEAQPDLLFQLVTLMNPQRLREAGVEVYACNQRAGEFVVTFPKAYHAGFNHGFNFNEAVNFALPDWLSLGLDCVKRYQEHRKHPVFSHDELIVSITQQSQAIKTAIWLNDSLQEMVERELSARQRARAMDMGEILEEFDRPEDHYQCKICNCFCYLSQITCSCTTKVVCIDHADELCKCAKTSQVLRKRFSDSYLQDTQYAVAERAGVPSAWESKFEKLLSESALPPLRTMRALLAEGDRISFPLKQLHHLRKCVTRANEWVDAANSFLVRKPNRKHLNRRVRGKRDGSSSLDDVLDKPDRSLADLYSLLKEVQDLGFDSPEIALLQQLAKDAEETKTKARQLLETVSSTRDRDAFIRECEELISKGSSLNVQVDELMEIEKIVLREQLLKELDQENHEQFTLEDVRRYINRARACALPADNRHMKSLENKLRLGTAWEDRVKTVLDKPHRALQELEEAAKIPPGVPIDPNLLEMLKQTSLRGRDIERQITAWLSGDSALQKPRVQEVVKMVTRAEKEFDIAVVRDMRRTVDFAVDLETRCDAVLKNRYQHTEENDLFQTMRQWKNYAKEHLSIFTLPNFERLDKQLTLHFRWLEGLPWFCRSHMTPHGKAILDDVVESTRPEDDQPPQDEYFTCICNNPVRPPAPGQTSDAVQCDHCFARFHGVCAANGGSCPFCDHQHWNGTIRKERSWHFCYLPTMMMHAPEITKNYSEDWKQLEIIVHRVERLVGVIGQFLAYVGQPGNQRADYIPQVRHFMRKLYKIQFAVSPNPETSYGLDLAGLHRVLAGQPAPVRMKKRRRPKFTFGQDVDKDWVDGTRCICRGRTSYLLNYPTVECEVCNKTYHGGCVFFPVDPTPGGNNRFMCPLCCLRKNRTYPYSEVRVKHHENIDTEAYVDTKEMLDTFSKEVIYMKLPPPYTQTLFVELVRFTPGQPDSIAGPPMNGIPPPGRSAGTPVSGHPPYQNGGSPHHRTPSSSGPSISSAPPRPVSPPMPYERTPSGGPHNIPPPPPWSASGRNGVSSRWSNAAATAPPPTARGHPPESHSPLDSPPLANRKRKHPDESPNGSLSVTIPSPTMQQPSPKRRPPMHSPLTNMPPLGHGVGQSPVHTATHPPQPVLPPLMHPSSSSHMQAPMPNVRPPPQGPMHQPVHVSPMQPMHSSPPMHQPIHNGAVHSPVQPMQTPPMQPSRANQGLSPSLAMMLSPIPSDVVMSPPRSQAPPAAPPPPQSRAMPPHVSPHGVPQAQQHPQMHPAMDQMQIPRHPMGRNAFDRYVVGPPPQSPTDRRGP
ncbi:PLU-1-like protein-domain-containing protein [Phanerochaete sordida]|uniref:[histone H3]-trimethyl-L-lysine(4) demethylase n=1 Tax=Phanerochaete sordida TaxID=48140 RepID=A0A9P3FXU1_9APHY|nr:PLU-1-like protein-domain-containing protein [Phanerochaete sordida]